jgi:hypothetical protein
MRKITDLALAAAFGLTTSASALADSKSAAEFTLATCLPAMDGLSKVGAIARENNWTLKRLPPNDLFKSNSLWDVVQGEDRFSVNVWISHLGEADYNICFVRFPGNNVNREEFLSFISASIQLVPLADTRFAQIQMRSERYEIKSNRAKMLALGIQSQPDGNVTVASITETPRFLPVPAPAAPSGPDK